MTDHWLKSFRLSNICTNFIEEQIYVYRYLTINNNVSFLVYHSLFVCLHLIMYTHCRSRNCLPFRNPWGHPQYLVRFVLLDLCFCMYVLYNVVCKQLFTDQYNKTQTSNVLPNFHTQMLRQLWTDRCYNNKKKT
jgi:hypothetical protein